jgi:MPBQ/MSBQ methyltransferase
MAEIDVRVVDEHYGSGSLLDRVVAGLELEGKTVGALAVDDLAPVDEFHTRGREATLEVARLANLTPADRVLDVGCGLGGTARYLAEQFGCQVVGVDLTEEYIEVGKKLTDLVGLSDRVELCQGSALDLPFDDERFDIVWTEHVQMNIADKTRFYREIARVLKPGGHLLFHDIFQGPKGPPFYPVPWAGDASISALVTEQEARRVIEQAGLRVEQWIGKVPESLGFFQRVCTKIDADGPPPIGIHLLMGNNAKMKLKNCLRNLSEERVSVALGMACKM